MNSLTKYNNKYPKLKIYLLASMFPISAILLAIIIGWIAVDYKAIEQFLMIWIPIIALVFALVGPMIKVHSWLPKN